MKRTLFTLLVILAAACGRSPRVHQIRNLGSTPYQEDTIRLTYGRDPERALVLLDSAVLLTTYDIMERQMGAAFSQGSEFDSLPDFIRDCRLEYARELIVSRPDLTFSEIVDASGFLHATTFSVDFKHKYGLTPTQYREQNV